MKVILTTNIKKLGKIGELVKVKDGYARNYLFPNKMALRENKKNIEYYEKIKEEIKFKENEKLEEAKELLENIANSRFAIKNSFIKKCKLSMLFINANFVKMLKSRIF